MRPRLVDKEAYKELMYFHDIPRLRLLSLGDYSPALKILYQSKFFEAIEENWMPTFENYIASVTPGSFEVTHEGEYLSHTDSARENLRRMIDLLRREVYENAVWMHEAAHAQFQRQQKAKEDVEKTLVEINATVARQHSWVESTITSTVRSVNRHFQGVLDRLGYEAMLEYRNREQGDGHRRLALMFRKKSEAAFRVVDERGGLSGGEHSAVSLMLLYSIMVVKEENMKIRSGGYLLLDEWDANLDAINSRKVFEILKNLGKKIISITPRSHSQSYLDEFGVVVRVLLTKGHSIAALLDKEKDIDVIGKMFEEMKQEETRKVRA